MDNQNRKLIANQKSNPDGSKTSSAEMHIYSAPLPPPAMMLEYENVVKGSAERIIRRFEIQSDHRQQCERVFVWTQSIKSIGGLVAGFLLSMTAVLGGIYTVLQGRPFLGGALSFTGLAILTGAFVADKIFIKSENKEEENN
jgi:uncharacterized membrane protein